jgi:CRISPR-associated endonuclease/helicase Cas3
MTSIETHAGRPEAEPWIRGWHEEEAPQTAIAWRKHLPVTDRGRLIDKVALETFREAADPHLAERLETETWRVIEWLHGRVQTLENLGPDETERDQVERPLRRADVTAVILDGPFVPRALTSDDLSDKRKRDTVERALAGGLLLVDARLGGLADGLLDIEAGDEVPDLTLSDEEDRVVPFRVRRTAERNVETLTGWRAEARIAVREDNDEEVAWLLIESLTIEAAGSEEGRAIGMACPQLLGEHETWVEKAAANIAKRLGLSELYSSALRTAARLHDEGKQTARWQRSFRAPPDGVYAKCTARPNLALLDHYRHELGSLPYAERHPRVQALEAPLRELCLHLIAAHHGNARPLLRTDGAEEPPSRLAQRAQEVAQRFVRLERRWGPWGLAWWEALLRAADQQASRQNEETGANRG